jgi:mycothiol synthase
MREVMLYVEADNEAAVAMYRKLGFTHWRSDVAYLR